MPRSVPAAMPLVSVVVPVYNGERFLRESLDSILAQTYPHCEIVVVDDGSTDATPGILESYGDAVVAVRQPRNRGSFGSTWDGIRRARGELIACYHADDVYGEEIVEREVAFLLRHPQAGAVFASDVFVDEDNVEYARLALPPEVRGEEPLPFSTLLDAILTYKNRQLRTPSAMVRASVFREMEGFREELYGASTDLDNWLTIARRHPVGILEEHLFRYRHHRDNAYRRANFLRVEPEMHFVILDRHLDEGARAYASPAALAAHEANRAEDHLRIAVNHYLRDELGESRRALRRVHVRRLLARPSVARLRALGLLLAFLLLTRLPRSRFVADLFRRRWYPWAA